jgi:hypothetical protein
MKFRPEDRADSDTEPDMVDGVDLGISFSGGPSEEQGRKLLEIAPEVFNPSLADFASPDSNETACSQLSSIRIRSVGTTRSARTVTRFRVGHEPSHPTEMGS